MKPGEICLHYNDAVIWSAQALDRSIIDDMIRAIREMELQTEPARDIRFKATRDARHLIDVVAFREKIPDLLTIRSTPCGVEDCFRGIPVETVD